MDYIEKFQMILKDMSTTKLRKIVDEYANHKGFPRWTYKEKNQKLFYYSEFDCRRRLRTICRFHDGKHEVNIALRKKAGYYFILELDRVRIFECEPKVLVNDEEKCSYVLKEYRELFEKLFE